jgi:hypothetical protein
MILRQVCLILIGLVLGLTAIVNAKVVDAQFEPWTRWYPVDRGQADGQRALRWWTGELYGPIPSERIFGQSTLRIAGAPATFPAVFGGHVVTYFYNWICESPSTPPNSFTSADCRYKDWTFVETMSQGTASGTAINLEHWARGFVQRWEVYYRPGFLKDCSLDGIQNEGISDDQLMSPGAKMPLIMRLPSFPGTYVGDPVCMITYKTVGLEKRSEIVPNWTGMLYVVTRTLDRYTDAFHTEIIKARNEYYLTNGKNPDIDHYCLERRDPLYCDGTHAKAAMEHGITAGLVGVETYWMRQVQPNNNLTNGFAAYHAFGWPENVDDRPDVGTHPPAQIWHITVY